MTTIYKDDECPNCKGNYASANVIAEQYACSLCEYKCSNCKERWRTAWNSENEIIESGNISLANFKKLAKQEGIKK